jgi:uncharacterized protein involved in cysteine biosynthesis
MKIFKRLIVLLVGIPLVLLGPIGGLFSYLITGDTDPYFNFLLNTLPDWAEE